MSLNSFIGCVIEMFMVKMNWQLKFFFFFSNSTLYWTFWGGCSSGSRAGHPAIGKVACSNPCRSILEHDWTPNCWTLLQVGLLHGIIGVWMCVWDTEYHRSSTKILVRINSMWHKTIYKPPVICQRIEKNNRNEDRKDGDKWIWQCRSSNKYTAVSQQYVIIISVPRIWGF